MNNPVVAALRQAAERVGKALSEDAGRAIEKMYRDAGRRTEGVVKRVTEADAEHARKLLQIADQIGAKDTALAATRDIEQGAALNTERAVLRKQFEHALGPLGTGGVDEGAKTFNPAERCIADLLAGEGRRVTAQTESAVDGVRTADAMVDGAPTEFKSLSPGAAPNAVKNALNSAKGQAGDAVLDARGSGLTASGAQEGLVRFLRNNPPGRMSSIRIIGDEYEINWP
ncbi:hypothetical protein KGA66_11010 [Actinocrinis puniceicyclus]|uniref:tRNA nuclease CdiA C-terminal domain-containing protein n=1 Tax=Actinocrinis puniceicyclus TaxID=977794 RepID=A0A8J8BEA6_9ACTN|nr:hypothetical protein [Actinocrinis puniceicyclus]MBS2963579.1 hypothetical protein [Actinocrinis puniceicyclus]